MSHFRCLICTCATFSELGVCPYCRDSITPSYIPESQRDKYMKLYLKEKYELYNM